MSDELAYIYAPWDDETVEKLNRYQKAGAFHPYTCMCPSSPKLTATREGWKCDRCDWFQEWAFAISLDERFQHPPLTREWCEANGVKLYGENT